MRPRCGGPRSTHREQLGVESNRDTDKERETKGGGVLKLVIKVVVVGGANYGKSFRGEKMGSGCVDSKKKNEFSNDIF